MNINDMWERLAQHQPYADQRGYGPEWAKMCAERTKDAAKAARAAANAALAVDAQYATWAAAEATASWVDAEAVAVKAVEWIAKAEELK